MGKQRVLDFIGQHKLIPVPIGQVSTKLGYSRQYVHAIVQRAGLPVHRNIRPRHRCPYCRKEVKPRHGRPSRYHAACKPTLTAFTCAYCGKPGERYISEVVRSSLHFCDNECRLKAVREGMVPVGPK